MKSDQLIVFGSIFDSHKDTLPKPFELPWSEFVELVMSSENFRTREDKFEPGWGFNLARFVERSDGRINRDNAHVDVLSGIVLDFDKNYDLAKMFEGLKGIVHLAYTTFSHTPEQPRWRVIVPTAQPIAGPRFPAARAWLVTCLNGGHPPSTKRGADEQAKAISNFFFAPGCPAANVEHLAWTESDPDAIVVVPPLIEELQKGIPETRLISGTLDWPWLEAKMKAYNKNEEIRRGFKAMLKGHSIAPQGERDNLITRMCGVLAGWAPSVEPEALAVRFASSLHTMTNESPGDPPPDLDNVADKIARAQASLAARSAESGEHTLDVAQVTRLAMPVDTEAFTQAAQNVGLEGDDLLRRLMLRMDGSVWVWFQDRARWEGPFTDKAAVWVVQQELPHVPGVNAYTRKKDGSIRPKTLEEFATDHGEVLFAVTADLNVTQPHYDIATRRLTLVGAERRAIEPEFDKTVDEWLRLLAGDRADVMLDWIAGLLVHDRPNSILFMPGDPGVGKSLLVRGLARVWNVDGATNIQNVVQNFNDVLRECPLVVLDEGKWDKWTDVTTLLRSLVTDSKRTINKKYHQQIELSGHIRMMITANNFNIFAGDEHSLTPADQQAFAQRFLEVTPHIEAKKFLQKLPHSQRDGLASDNRIAKHALWLGANRVVHNEESRFWVTGDDAGSLADKITGSDKKFGSWVHEWVAKYLTNPAQIEREQGALIWRRDGRVIVSPEAVVETWEKTLKNRKPPQSLEIANVLKTLSSGKLVAFPDKSARGFELRTDTIVRWSEEHGIGNPDAIAENAKGNKQINAGRPGVTGPKRG